MYSFIRKEGNIYYIHDDTDNTTCPVNENDLIKILSKGVTIERINFRNGVITVNCPSSSYNAIFTLSYFNLSTGDSARIEQSVKKFWEKKNPSAVCKIECYDRNCDIEVTIPNFSQEVAESAKRKRIEKYMTYLVKELSTQLNRWGIYYDDISGHYSWSEV